MDACISLSFTWPEQKRQPARRGRSMADDAIFTTRANPYARPTDHRRLDELLDNWAKWMRGYEMQHRLSTKTSHIFSSGSSDFDGMVNEADLRDASVVNAVIEDLSPAEQCSVHNKHLNAVWRFNRESSDDVYLRARAGISGGLFRKGVFE